MAKKVLSTVLLFVFAFAFVFQFLVHDSFAQSPPRNTTIFFQRMDGFLHFIECEDRASLVAEVGTELYEEEHQAFCDFAEDLWKNGFVLVESPDCGLYDVSVEPGYYTYTISNGFSRVKQCNVYVWLLDKEEQGQLSQVGLKDFFFGADRLQMLSLSKYIHQEFESEEKSVSLNGKNRDTVVFTRDVELPNTISRYEVIHYDRFLVCVSYQYLGGDPNNLPDISIVEMGAPASNTNLQWYWILLIAFSVVILTVIVTLLLLRRRKKAKAVLCASGEAEPLEGLLGAMDSAEESPMSPEPREETLEPPGVGTEDPPEDTE